MRNFITIMENIGDESLVEHIARMVRQGYHEGFEPYWKLVADPRILKDEAAMHHVSELISAGFVSGLHPSWELKVIEQTDEIRNATHSHMTPMDDFPVVNSKAGENALAKRLAGMTGIVDEEEIEESPKAKHRVVPVHQKMGAGAGWWECPDEHAELFVVEDDMGEPVEDGAHHDRNSADAHCHHLNTGEQMLDEIDIDPTDNGDIPYDHPDMVAGRSIQDYLDKDYLARSKANRFSDSPDHEVEVAAIHSRGSEQDEAMEELQNRGIELTDNQLSMARR